MKTTIHHLTITITDDGGAAAHNPLVLPAAVRGALETGIGSFMLDSAQAQAINARFGVELGTPAEVKPGEHNLPPVVTAEVTHISERRDAIRKEVERAWLSRAKAQGLKPGTVTYRNRKVEFITGAMSALNAAFPGTDPALLSNAVHPAWVVRGISGRAIVDPKEHQS